ncbi:MAG: glycosyltransferase family 39 protein [Acidobacteriota bacterium]
MDGIYVKWGLRAAAALALTGLLAVAAFFRGGAAGALGGANICAVVQCTGASASGMSGSGPTGLTFTGESEIAFELDRDKQLQIACRLEGLQEAAGYGIDINGQWFFDRQAGSIPAQEVLSFCGKRGLNRVRLAATGPGGRQDSAPMGTVRFAAFSIEAANVNDVFPFAKAGYVRRSLDILAARLDALTDPASLAGALANPYAGLGLFFLCLLLLDAAASGKGPQSMPGKLLRAAHIAGLGLFALLAGIVAFKSLAGMAHTLALPMEGNPVEGRELYKGALFPDLRAMYTAADAYNYLITIYPPVYSALVKAATLFLGETLQASRAVSILFWAVLIGSLGWLILRATGSRVLAAIAALILACDPTLSQWAALGRPDATAWGLLALGLLAFLSGLEGRRGHLYAAAGLCAAAIFTKQQTLPIVLGMLCFGLYGPRREDVFKRFALPFGAIALATALALNALTGGNFLFNILEYPVGLSSQPDFNRTRWLLDRLETYFSGNFAMTASFLLLSLAGLLRGAGALPLTLLLVYLPFYVSLMRSWGADTNYSLGVILLVTVGTVAACARLFDGGRRQVWLCCAVMCLALAGGRGAQGLTWSGLPAFAALPGAPSTEEFTTFRRRLGNITSAITGPTLCDSESYFLLAGGKSELFTFDSMEMLCYEKSGQWCWPCSPLLKDIAARRFHLVLLRNDMESVITRTVREHYKPIEVCAEHTLLVAKP